MQRRRLISMMIRKDKDKDKDKEKDKDKDNIDKMIQKPVQKMTLKSISLNEKKCHNYAFNRTLLVIMWKFN